MEILKHLNQWLGEIIIFFGIIGSVYIFVQRSLNKIKPYSQILENVNNLNKKIDEISKEFKTNHGTSLKDQISKIEKAVDENTKLTKSIFNRQRWILDNREEPIFEADSDGNFTWVNEAFVKIVKRSHKDLLGNKWRIIVTEEKRNDIYSHWESAIKEKRNFEEKIFFTDKKGNKLSANCVASLQEDGNYIGTLTNIQDHEDCS